MGRRLTDGGRPWRPGEKGFSLLELIVVLAILGLVAAIGTPNVVSWLARLRSRAAADEVVSTLQSARLQAIARNVRLQVCLYRNATPHDFLTLSRTDPLQPDCPAPPAPSNPAYAAFRRAMTELPGVRIASDDPPVVCLRPARHGDRRQFYPRNHRRRPSAQNHRGPQRPRAVRVVLQL